MEPDVALGELLPGGMETVQGQPAFEPPLHRLVAGEARGQQFPADAGDQDVKESVQAVAVAVGLAADALVNDRGQDRLEYRPDVFGDAFDEVSQFHRWGLRGSSWT